MLVNNHRKIFLSLIPKKPRDFVDCSLGTNFRGTRVSNWPRKKKTRPDVVARAVSWEQFSEAWPHSWSMVLRGWKKNEEQENMRPSAIWKTADEKKNKKKERGGKGEMAIGGMSLAGKWASTETKKLCKRILQRRAKPFVWLLFDRDATPSSLLAAN